MTAPSAWKALTHARDPDSTIETGAICGWRRVTYREFLDALLRDLLARDPSRSLRIDRDEATGQVALCELAATLEVAGA